MQYLKTSAFAIDENTYSLAVAILPPVFATIPVSEVLGYYVVINQPSVQYSHNEEVQALVLGCAWMSKNMFFEMYETVNAPITMVFTEVTAIA